ERTVTYSLKPGVGDADALSIDPQSGAVRLLAPANYEAKRSYRFVVVARDGGSPALTVEKSVTVTVQDVDEPAAAPVISAPARLEVIENRATRLIFPSAPFRDAESPAGRRMTVTLGVADGLLVGTTGGGVTVGGTATQRTFRGTLAALNAYFTSGRIAYHSVRDAAGERQLRIDIREVDGDVIRTSTAEVALDILSVDDAPRLEAPAAFTVVEDVAGNLVWPAALTPFADTDSDMLTVTLAVGSGRIESAGNADVTVGGTATARTFSGSPFHINLLFRQPGGITYTPAADATGRVTLTTTVDDGTSRVSAATRILIEAVDDAPTQRETGLVLGAEAGRPFRIGVPQLAAATGARDVDSPRLSFIVTGTTSGRVERNVGGRWVPIAADAPARTRIIDGRRPFRWIAPADAVGTTPAFTVRAWDGRSASETTSQISVSIAATDDTAFAYFIDENSQVPNVPAGYGVISEFSEAQRAAAVASGRIVGESAAMFNQQADNTVGYSLWPLISDLFQSRTPVAAADKPALAAQILGRVLVNPGLSATSEFPSPDEGTPASPGAGYVIWAQDFEFRPGVVPTTDVYAGVTAVLWAGRTYLGESFKIMPVPSSSLFKTLGDATPGGKGLYVADEIINGTVTTPYLASLGLEGLPENPQEGSNGQWNFLSLLYANGLI
ncbi:MAG: cadherin repeat domain-containing protein, partial [Planctomycetia bacterium]|nr:cadherin repeat domain-containing protein [Planctomycetia bacterium]